MPSKHFENENEKMKMDLDSCVNTFETFRPTAPFLATEQIGVSALILVEEEKVNVNESFLKLTAHLVDRVN